MHLVVYLNIWLHPALEQFLHGLGLSAFYFNTSGASQSLLNNMDSIWECGIKKIMYLNYCNYRANLIFVSIAMLVGLVVIGLGRLLIRQFNPDRHRICWNHVNNFYWLFSFPIFFAVFDAPLPVFAPVAVGLGMLTISIWYQSIKNIFNNTYAESTFFWALKKGKSSNPLSNSNYPMAMCRRLLLTIFISVHP